MLLGMTLVMGVMLGGWSSLLTNYYMQKAAFIHRIETIDACLVSLTNSVPHLAYYCHQFYITTHLFAY